MDTTSLNRERNLRHDDFASEDLTRSCEMIEVESKENARVIVRIQDDILANRERNQAALYFGSVIFLPALVAVKPEIDERELISTLQKRQDVLSNLAKFNKC
ncbi:hypothetical protein JJL56_03465 [Azospirillum sp. YIM DDC1]|uniref:Uncharacterized protein n=1 Tax=Azospirillum aestuarii TaxID=2802052 RepID=A0ABS1HSW1_9PROT|nr:hypothetical protein [Azospirillum aestuarii]MBK4717918.1 hypothetical protein [Azospirillum aestuarii]